MFLLLSLIPESWGLDETQIGMIGVLATSFISFAASWLRDRGII